MLALSTQLARYPWSESLAHQASARSSICGSTIALGLDLDGEGKVSTIGLKVSACAVGQSSAAILAGGVAGATPHDLSRTLAGLKDWLSDAGAGAGNGEGKGEATLPQWPGLVALAGARDYPARRGALLLPWEAAVKALSSAQ
jgi:NifU-like protein involved in Fe-S cluster formation